MDIPGFEVMSLNSTRKCTRLRVVRKIFLKEYVFMVDNVGVDDEKAFINRGAGI